MEAKDYELLKERLLESGYPDLPITDNAVKHLLELKGEAADMLKVWMETRRIPRFEAIEGIDKRFLRDVLKMKDPAIIIAFGMLKENPKYNALLLKKKAADLGYIAE